MIFAVMLCHLTSSDRSAWKIQAWTVLEPCLRCGGVVFHQLNYRANWELDIMWVYDKPVDSGCLPFNEWIFIWTVDGNNFNVNELRGFVMLRQLLEKNSLTKNKLINKKNYY